MLLRYLGYINYKIVSPDGKTRIGQIRKVTEEEGRRLLTSDPNAWEIIFDEPIKDEIKVVIPDAVKTEKVEPAIELDETEEKEAKEVKKAGRPKKSSRLGF